MAQLTSAELDAIEKEIEQIDLLTSPAKFAQILSANGGEPWVPYRHLQLIDQKLVDLAEGRIKRLMVTVPPRHGKSWLCSVFFPAWYLNRYPDRRVILCSYGDDFAATWGRQTRNLLQTHQAKLRIQVDEKSKAADRWDLQGTRGGMKTAGVGGQITGMGAHMFIIDDVLKNAEEANSATVRGNQWEWWQRTASTRLQPITKNGQRVQDPGLCLILTRWNEDDLAGRFLLEDKQRVAEGLEPLWECINLPALAEENDPLGRTPGTALCPEIFNENALAAQREVMGAAGFAALYQQRPQPEGGGAFKRDHFQYWTQTDQEGFTYRLENRVDGTILAPQEECWRFITMDLAVKARQTSDYTVAAVWDVAAWLEPSALILRHIERVRIEGAEHVDLVRQLWKTWNPSFIGIEEAMQGTQTIDFARREGIAVLGLKHRSKDKAFRAKDAQLMCEMHRVYFPKKAVWLGEYEHELLLFPSGTHDDQVDVFSYAAMEVLRGVNMTRRKPPEQPTTLTDRVWANMAKRVKAAERNRRHGKPAGII